MDRHGNVSSFYPASYSESKLERKSSSWKGYTNPFAFFDFEEPLVFFSLDYLAVMGLFVFLGYYLSEILKKVKSKK